MRNVTLLLSFIFLLNCSKSDDANTTTAPIVTEDPTPTGSVIGIAGISEWDKLAVAEKEKVTVINTLFIHASVGGDLEDGTQNNGFQFNFYDGNTLYDGLNGADWNSINDGNNISNGEPEKKIAAFKREALQQKSKLKVAVFKFGYADITDENLESVKILYKQMIDDLRIAGLKFVHITPPLVYIKTADDGNAAKMKMATWMKSTFKDKDVIYDLQEIESDKGACNLGGVWTICDKYRSTESCPSKGQGVDAPEGQGHICESQANRMSKAFLLSIYKAVK
jgi:hypothetical protein